MTRMKVIYVALFVSLALNLALAGKIAGQAFHWASPHAWFSAKGPARGEAPRWLRRAFGEEGEDLLNSKWAVYGPTIAEMRRDMRGPAAI